VDRATAVDCSCHVSFGHRGDARSGLTEQFLETRMAVRLLVLFFERPLVELFQAKSAHEMLRMELLEHGRDATARDRLVTSGAQ